jgi:hypothetical protein
MEEDESESNVELQEKLSTNGRGGGGPRSGWPDWANFRPLGECFYFGYFFKLQK